MALRFAAGLTFLVTGWVVPPAFAHRLGADCKVTGKQVEVEAFFDDGAAARGARVTVRDATNKIVAEGRTDAKGRWTSAIALPGRYQVEVNAGEGHRTTAYFTIPAATPEDLRLLVRRVKAVGAEGAGNPEAAGAWSALILSGPEAILPLLVALDDADGAATNWLRGAIDLIAERTLAAKQPLPAADLERFVCDRKHAPRARRLAFEWLLRAEDRAARRLLPDMLDDPSLELRRDAVAWYTRKADELLAKGQRSDACAAYRKALAAARDRDQVQQLAGALDKLGVKVDIAAHFGFVRCWHVIGPFANDQGAGWAQALPPEQKIDLTAAYPGKNRASIRWTLHTTADPYGVVDLNAVLGNDIGVIAYAYAAVFSAEERPVDIRAGSNNLVKIFLNGRVVYDRELAHHGMRMDQHVGRGTLCAGRNEILVKVCKDDNPKPQSQQWSFQLRLCDLLGGGMPLRPEGDPPTRSPDAGKGKP